MPQLALTKQLPGDIEEDVPFADKPPKERYRILKMLLGAGIFFLWDAKRGRFISTKTGRVIRADTLRRFVMEAAAKSEERLASLAERLAPGPIAGVIAGPGIPGVTGAGLPAIPAAGAITQAERLAAGEITQREFQVAMQKEIVKAESAMVASAVGGLKQMKQPEWQKVAIQIRQQQGSLMGFGKDIVTSRLSPAQIAARARLYARAIYATHMNEMTDFKKSMGARFARRILHQGAIHCEECPDLAARGWVPIEDLVPIGDTPCIVNCRCAIEYSGEGEPNQARLIGMPD
jgi:hypothetical protein